MKVKFSTKLSYLAIILICIVAIFVAVYMQFFKDDNLGAIVGIVPKAEEQEKYEELKNNFNNMFNNTFESESIEINNLEKLNEEYDYIANVYTKKEKVDNKYELNINIPNINIKDESLMDINYKINEIFYTKAVDILENVEDYTIYTVEYSAYINENILHLIIKSTLKEGANAQRVMLQTYSYDLNDRKILTLAEILEKNNINKNDVSKLIKDKIREEQKKTEELERLGYEVYRRDVESEIYDIENTDEFFIDKNKYLYILYPYGNGNFTSEMDMVILNIEK